MQGQVKTLLDRYSSVLLALATLAGTFVGALSVNKLWLFYVLAPAAGLIVGATWAWPKVARALSRLRDYDRLQGALQSERQRAHQAEQKIEDLRVESAVKVEAARLRAREEVLGAAQAIIFGTQLTAIGIAMRNGELVIAASYGSESVPVIGSRYELLVGITGERQGTLRVVERSPDGMAVLLTPVEEDVPDFWAALKTQAAISSTLSDGLLLAIPSLPELGHLEGKDYA
jgi:hypothetical protein